MRTETALDTLEVVKRLTEAGFSDTQAKAVTAVLRDSSAFDLAQLVTKADLALLHAEQDARIGFMKSELEGRIGFLKSELEARIEAAKSEVIKWVVGTEFAQVAMILAVLRMFPSAHP